jgi:thiol-disulfide isomerase/thioredoxin
VKVKVMKRNLLWLLVYLGAFCALSFQPHAARAQHIAEQRGVKIYGPAAKEAPAAAPAKPADAKESAPKTAVEEDQPDEPEQIADGLGIFTLSGKPVELASLLRRGRPYVINFWATWCGPCREELPHLMQLATAYKTSGLQIIGLNVENPYTEDRRVRTFLSQMHANYPMLYGSSKACQALNNNRPCGALPYTFVIAANGAVIARFAGYQPGPLGIAVGQAARSVNAMSRPNAPRQ